MTGFSSAFKYSSVTFDSGAYVLTNNNYTTDNDSEAVTVAAAISLAKVISREKEAIALAITEKKAAISLVHDTTAKAVISKEKAVISSVRAATIVVHVLLATILMQSTA